MYEQYMNDLWQMFVQMRVQKVNFSAPRRLREPEAHASEASFAAQNFQEERSVGKTYMSTCNVSGGNILRKHTLFEGERKIRCRVGSQLIFVIKRGLFEQPL
ncbi:MULTISPECIES: hypothetical protein [unclassified Paenibacillus]|uniref:hypothetical protein n=1 Tax=unclassified Paenibacillus TaxID=185978 RepID=UPI001C0FAEDE|nr:MULTISPECIES: hypothetical protein [unclassified Paenibacillus]MBU5444681.1 hypothetical protein [Paenibacillus sp. MSJ-34]CAH0119142.1 hypothetical protein PAE9249_01640 [Paenibacillus sp. CECT 9249]